MRKENILFKNVEASMYFKSSIQRDFSNDTNVSVPNGLAKLIMDIERDNGKEIYNLTYEEIVNSMLRCSNIRKFDSIRVNLNFIVRYIKWMQQKKGVLIAPNVILNNYLCSDTTKLIKECLASAGMDDKKKIIYRSPEEFAEVLAKAFELDSIETSDAITFLEITAVYLMLVYQGLTKKEILDLRLAMIKERNGLTMIVNKAEEVVVYDAFSDLVYKVLRNRKFLIGYGRQNESEYILGDSADDFFIKTHNIRKDLGQLLNRSVYKGSVRYREITGEKADLSVNNVYKMGEVYRFMQEKDTSFTDEELIKYFTKRGFTKAAAYDVLQYCKQW